MSTRSPENKKHLVFRADGNQSIGYGHIIRSVALAEMLKEVFPITFFCSKPDAFIVKQVEEVGALVSLPGTEQYYPDDSRSENEIPFDLEGHLTTDTIVVLDGYRFGTGYREAIKKQGALLICIEDIPSGFYPADMIISSSPLLTKDDFNALPGTHFCLGLAYSLLRKQFKEGTKQQNPRDGVFISMGGIDYYEVTSRIVDLLLKETNKRMDVVYTQGFSPENIHALESLKQSFPNRLQLHTDLDAEEMVTLMDACEMAVLPSSGVLIEALSRGLQIFAGCYANNQSPFYEWLVENKIVGPVGDFREQWTSIATIINAGMAKTDFRLTLKSNTEWIQAIRLL